MLDERVKEKFVQLWGMDPDEYVDVTRRQDEEVLSRKGLVSLARYQWDQLSAMAFLKGHFQVADDYPAPGYMSTHVVMPFLGKLRDDMGGLVFSARFPVVGYRKREDDMGFFIDEFWRRFQHQEYVWPEESSAARHGSVSGLFSRVSATVTSSFLLPEIVERYLRKNP
ncbi:MAG: hypothetical protein ACLFO2_04895 [Candidatus Woesearchaeota archaeon]